MRSILCLAVCAVICTGQADQNAHPVKNPLAAQPAALDAGKTQFGAACAACHGANAEGGRGPNLTDNDRIRRMTDDQLFNTIRRGIPGGGMPAFPLPDETIWQIVTYVRSLSTPAFLAPVAGDVQAGRAVYEKSKCASCHMIMGKRGFLGPDLTDVAASRTLKQLRQAIVAPAGTPFDGFNGVTVTLKNGERISGIGKNYSDYSIDILDATGKLHLLETAQLSDEQFATKSLMPDDYANTLSAQELQNLIAFLSRQTVRPDARPDQKVRTREEH